MQMLPMFRMRWVLHCSSILWTAALKVVVPLPLRVLHTAGKLLLLKLNKFVGNPGSYMMCRAEKERAVVRCCNKNAATRLCWHALLSKVSLSEVLCWGLKVVRKP